MQTSVIVLVVVVGMCGARPSNNPWWGKLKAGNGHYVVTQDKSFENGAWQTDYSLEYLPSYHGVPLTKSATGQGATSHGVTGGATGHQYYHIGLDSSPELYYPIHGAATKGAPHTARVKALSDMLNWGIVDLTNESTYFHGPIPSAHTPTAAHTKHATHRQYIKVDDSAEDFYHHLALLGQYQGHTQSQTGVHVTKK